MTLTLQQRLDIYRKAKEDYVNKILLTQSGFCYYFNHTHDIFIESLPELMSQYPACPPGEYWFGRYGPIPERIACIEAAIKLCEEQLKRQHDIEHT